MTFKRNIMSSMQDIIRHRVTLGPGVLSGIVWLLLLLFLFSNGNGNCCSNNLMADASTSPSGEMESCCTLVEPIDASSHHGSATNTHQHCTGGCAEQESCAFCSCQIEELPEFEPRAVIFSKRNFVSVYAVFSVAASEIAPKFSIPYNAVHTYRVVCPSVPAYLMNRVLLN